MRFYMTHVTKEFHRVHPKWFLRLWYIWCKLWIYLASILTLSLNGLKWDSTWPTSPRSFIGCVLNDFRAYGTFGANHAAILSQDHRYLQMKRNELPFEPRHLEYHSVCPKWFLRRWYIWHELCNYHALKLTLSPIGLKWDSTWPTSPRSSIGCVQIGFWGYGMFGANCGSILHQD
jgi:hypothetical protein